MLSPPLKEDITIFSRQSIMAMSPMAQNIAAMLQDSGYIKIVDEPAKIAGVKA